MNVWLWWVVMTVVLAAAVAVAGYAVVRRKQMHLWLWSYLRQRRPVVPDVYMMVTTSSWVSTSRRAARPACAASAAS